MIIINFLKDTVLPQIQSNNTLIDIPLLPANSQRWFSAQKFSLIRNKLGQIQCPIMIYKRSHSQVDQSIKIPRLNYNNPVFYQVMKKLITTDKYSKQQLNKIIKLIVPIFMIVNYQLIMWTDYVSQSNQVIQTINHFSRTYWGNDNIKFITNVKNYSQETQINIQQRRMVITKFQLQTRCFIIPNIRNVNNIKQSILPNKTILQIDVKNNIEQNINKDLILQKTKNRYKIKPIKRKF